MAALNPAPRVGPLAPHPDVSPMTDKSALDTEHGDIAEAAGVRVDTGAPTYAPASAEPSEPRSKPAVDPLTVHLELARAGRISRYLGVAARQTVRAISSRKWGERRR